MSRIENSSSPYPKDSNLNCSNLYGESIIDFGIDRVKDKVIKKYQNFTQAFLATSLLVSGSYTIMRSSTQIIYENWDRVPELYLNLPQIPSNLPELKFHLEKIPPTIGRFAVYNYEQFQRTGIYRVTCTNGKQSNGIELPYESIGKDSSICKPYDLQSMDPIIGKPIDVQARNEYRAELRAKPDEELKRHERDFKLSGDISKLIWGGMLMSGGLFLSRKTSIDKKEVKEKIRDKIISGIMLGVIEYTVFPQADKFFDQDN